MNELVETQRPPPLLHRALAEARLFLVFSGRGGLSALRRSLAVRTVADFVEAQQFELAPSADLVVDEPLWRAETLRPHPDLHHALGRVLGDCEETGGRPRFWRLNSRALAILNRRGPSGGGRAPTGLARVDLKAPPGFGMALRLTGSAAKRLGRQEDDLLLPVRMADVRFYLTQTRQALLVFEMVHPIDLYPAAGNVVEILHALAHDVDRVADRSWTSGLGRLDAWGGAAGSVTVPETVERVSVYDVAQHLLGPEGRLHGSEKGGARGFTYVMARTAAALTEAQADELASRLAHRHTADYSPAGVPATAVIARSFETVVHACTLEGGALLVTDCRVEFLKTFLSNVADHAYLILALAARKEFVDLLDLSQDAAITIEHEDKARHATLTEKLASMTRLQERLLNFRLTHRFSLASLMSNHNLVHAAWRKAFGVDRLLADVSGDVVAAESYLERREREHRAAAREQRDAAFAFWTVIGASIVGAFGLLAAGKAVTDPIADALGVASPSKVMADEVARTLGRHVATLPDTRGIEVALGWAPVAAAVITVFVGVLFAATRYRIARSQRIGHS